MKMVLFFIRITIPVRVKDIDQNSNGALNVFWGGLERQIRIEGKIKKVSSTISDQYFNARPRASQLGAWASNQSEILKDRNELTERLDYFDKKFKNMAVPRPPHWGGFLPYTNEIGIFGRADQVGYMIE